ncbi:MAG: hypothetical protein KatS3mg002_0316 [Candidatus Woesearchaeota archaeon]|nr:MAG: hypothetical protein KatS3mg002_0316 [Candidatus Woesearchaeota archaeon]
MGLLNLFEKYIVRLEKRKVKKFDWNAIIPNAPNFKYKEFIFSPIAIRYRIDNTPPKKVIHNIEELAVNILQPVRNKFGPIRITSGYRCEELNRLIKGSIKSYHLFGYAADFIPLKDDVKLIDIIEYIHTELQYTELIAEWFPDGWIHAAYKKGKYTKDIKLRDKTHFYTKVTLNDLKALYPFK